jgi:UDP-glucose 4-epimerase
MGYGWLQRLRDLPAMRVAVAGGSGRLGSWLTRFLVEAGQTVVVLDQRPPHPLPGLQYVPHELRPGRPVPEKALAGCDALVHLAGIHGAQLAAGVDRREFWPVNVGGTQALLEAAVRDGVPRFLFAGSTSVYGSSSPEHRPARILDEHTELFPEDVYDLTKVACEQLIREHTELDGTILRLGRFFFPSHAAYHLRKLSTGLDVHDACQAIVRVLTTARLPESTYCVASDMPLSVEQRQRLGTDLRGVLLEVVPTLVDAAAARGIQMPPRVGKSVCSDRLRRDAGYSPEWTLRLIAEMWAADRDGTGERPIALRPATRPWLPISVG